ncbi:MAG TPA: ATP-dependent helicase [Chloroflexota bacterium]|nr:ATP-dependent helicase [Chloroflexota bacterium]
MFDEHAGGVAWMDSLNAAQREAVTTGDGPVLVIAGAGSGKTWTLACRVAYLIQQGVPPERMLLLTFSRRAAREMLQRAARIVGHGKAQRVVGGTFHAVANRWLRLYGRPLGLRPDFTVLDQADSADLIDLIRGELHFDTAARERRFPKKDTLAAIYSRMVNAGQGLSAILETAYPWCVDEADSIRRLFAEFTQRKRNQNLLDYDDLLLFWRALAETPTGQAAARQVEHILVDEYQDTNPMQAQILLALRREQKNLLVVGDDAQAIYSFRCASVRNILDFPVHFPGARRITLEQSYRSTRPILDASNAVIALARERFPKELSPVRSGGARPRLLTCGDETEQSIEVCRTILEHREQGTELRRQAVLFRSGHHSDMLELELTRRNIPFVKYGGLKFLEAAHVKDVLSVLRILENPRDEVSWFRILQLLDGIGPASARSIIDTLGVRGLNAEAGASGLRNGAHVPLEAGPTGERLVDAAASPLRQLIESPPRVPEAAREPLARLRKTVADCLASQLPPASEIGRIRQFLEPIFERRYASAAARIQDIEQLEGAAATHTGRGRFLAELALDPPTSTSDLAGPPLLDEDYLILSTVHSAKGGEWDVVHVIHAADGMIPSDMSTGDAESIEEERRLFYVALTRARDMLYVYFPLRFYRRPHGRDDAHHYAQLTRFLPEAVRTHFECTSVGSAALLDLSSDGAGPTGRGPSAGAAEKVDALLASLWNA